MTARRAVADLSKRVTRVSITKALKPKERFFSTKKSEITQSDKKPTQRNLGRGGWPAPIRSDLIKQDKAEQLLNTELDPNEIVLKNMGDGRFSTRTLAAPLGTYYETSIVGSDVLINWFREQRGSFVPPEHIGLEMFDARSGERQKIDKNGQSLMTSSYIMFGENGVVNIRSRSDGTERVVRREVTKVLRIWKENFIPYNEYSLDNWTPNNNSSCEKVLIAGLKKINIVDLETGLFKEIDMPDKAHDFQLNGSLLAFRENYEEPTLRVIDTNSGNEIFARSIPKSFGYHLMEDKLVLSNPKLTKVTWSIIDLSGKTINEGSFETKMNSSKGPYIGRYVSVYKNFMIFHQSDLLHFVDITTGKLLTSFLASWIDKVSGFDDGKFIISAPRNIQVIDFESPDPRVNLPVRTVIINPNETLSSKKGTIGELSNSLSDGREDPKMFSPLTRIIRLTEKERISLVPLGNSTLVDRLLKLGKNRTRFNLEARHVPNSKVKIEAFGLLFKEVLVDGQWRPVDLSVKEVEELVNST